MTDYLFSSPDPPPVLYHYTSQQGLIGIVTNSCLWATDVYYLNDSSEHKYGEDLIKKAISKRKKKARGDTRKFFDEFAAYGGLFAETRFFIVSLTENGDLLSQWRAYTPDGNGFSLGFNVAGLQAVLSKRGEFNLVKCVYDESEQEDYVNRLIDEVISQWKNLDEPAPTEPGTSRLGIYPPALLRILCAFLAPIFKSKAFYEEGEWRLIFTPNDAGKLKFRPGKSMLIPYIEANLAIEVDFADDEEERGVIPIREVIVGPTPHAVLAMSAVRRLLASKHMEALIRMSDIPFRAW